MGLSMDDRIVALGAVALFVLAALAGAAQAQAIKSGDFTFTVSKMIDDDLSNHVFYFNASNGGSAAFIQPSLVFRDLNFDAEKISNIRLFYLNGMNWVELPINSKVATTQTTELKHGQLSFKGGGTTQFKLVFSTPIVYDGHGWGASGEWLLSLGGAILDPWFNSSYQYQLPIYLNSTVNPTLSSFIFAVPLNTSNSSMFGASCTNIRFATAADVQLEYELENSNATYCGAASTANATYWVGIPTTAAGYAFTEIYAYLGNVNASSGSSNIVWSTANFTSVYHFSQAGPNDTMKVNNLTVGTGTVSFINSANCKFGGCANFSNGAYLNKTNGATAPSGAGQSSFTCWNWRNDWAVDGANDHALFGFGSAVFGSFRAVWNPIGTSRLAYGDENVAPAFLSSMMHSGADSVMQYYGGITSDATHQIIIKNETANMTTTSMGATLAGGNIVVGSMGESIGPRAWFLPAAYQGLYDECRLSGVNRTNYVSDGNASAWFAAEYSGYAIVGSVTVANGSNVFVYDEETQASLAANLTYVIAYGANTTSGAYSNTASAFIPIFNSTATEITLTIYASAGGYTTRTFTYYFADVASFTASNPINIYLENSSLTKTTNINVLTNYGTPYANGFITIERLYTGTYVEIGSGQLDSNGYLVTFGLVPNSVIYRFNISSSTNAFQQSFGGQNIICDAGAAYCTKTFTLSANYIPDASLVYNGVYAGCSNTSSILTCQVNETQGLMDAANLTVFYNGSVVCSNQTTGNTSITVSCNFTNFTNKFMPYTLFVILDDKVVALSGALDGTVLASNFKFGVDMTLISILALPTLAFGLAAWTGMISMGIFGLLVAALLFKLVNILLISWEMYIALTLVGAVLIYVSKEWKL